ncbi:hypothetical protein V6N13_033627 [Hibiscus sabdariffa]
MNSSEQLDNCGIQIDRSTELDDTMANKNTVATRGVSKNAAYLAFNPPKKSLKKGSTNFGAVVVPSVTSQSVVMVEHGTNVASGAHTVVKIMEDRFGKSSSRTGSGGNS